MKTKHKKRRQYRKITVETIAKHKAAELAAGNGTRAVETVEPGYSSPKDRAYHIAKKSESMPTSVYLNNSLEQIAEESIQVLGELIHSDDEAIATRNVHYAIDHVKGKAVQKSVTLTGKLNIQSVLD